MAESIVKDFKGKLDWVYVGKAEAPTHKEKKSDLLTHEYMRGVLDVARTTAEIEAAQASVVQAKLAEKFAQEIVPKEMQGNKITQWMTKTRNQQQLDWLEMEKKFSSPEQQNRLGKLLVSSLFMMGSFGLNLGAEVVAKHAFDGERAKLLGFLSAKPDTGNKKMLEAGWQYLVDWGIEKAADKSAKVLANREDIGFISPLSRTISKIGNTVMNVTGLLGMHDERSMMKKAALNPGTIEGAIRFAMAVPKLEFLKEWYGKANSQIMKGEGLIPMGADLAFNMMFAKVSGQMEAKTANL